MKKNKTSSIALILIGMLTLILQGCATSGNNGSPLEPSGNDLPEDLQYTVKKGDLLGDISLTITGKMSSWKEIAAYNEITDPRTLKIGTVLLVPASLLPATQSRAIEAELTEQRSPKSQSIAAASNSSTGGSITATNALAVVQGGVTPENSQADVVIQPVTINRSFELNPIEEADLNTVARSEKGLNTPQIKVIGTYFPKGIYKEPASYSTLMMRVAPGTLFQLERQVNDWFKIVTADGIGYLRASDGVIVDNN